LPKMLMICTAFSVSAKAVFLMPSAIMMVFFEMVLSLCPWAQKHVRKDGTECDAHVPSPQSMSYNTLPMMLPRMSKTSHAPHSSTFIHGWHRSRRIQGVPTLALATTVHPSFWLLVQLPHPVWTYLCRASFALS
jgi:hypothetical protein